MKNRKVVKYGVEWCAYFKPKGWVNFGNSCRLSSRGLSFGYKTKKEAMADARAHWEKYGDDARPGDRL